MQRDMQNGFTDEIQRLQPGRCQFCGERWFAAQTSLQAAVVAGGQHTCDRCKRDKKKTVKSFSSANGIDPGSVPNQLKGLTQVEEMLIAKACLVMRDYCLKGGQRGYGGHVVNLAQNIGNLVNSLPRPARDFPIIVVPHQGGEGTHKDLLVRRQRVFTALNWLWANNTFYSDIRINANNLNALPDNGFLQDLYESCGDDGLDSERDTGPQQDGASERHRVFASVGRRERYAGKRHYRSAPTKNASGSAPRHPGRRWLPFTVSCLCRPLIRNGGLAPQRVQDTGAMYFVFPYSILVRSWRRWTRPSSTSESQSLQGD